METLSQPILVLEGDTMLPESENKHSEVALLAGIAGTARYFLCQCCQARENPLM